MRWQTEQTRARRVLTLMAVLLGATCLLPENAARGEQRKFAVMLAHSPKAFVDGAGRPGLPAAGLPNINEFKRDYFDRSNPNVGSFAEYWEEVTYGDVTISGDVFGWVNLPWPFEPSGPSAPDRASPADFINLHRNIGSPCDGGEFYNRTPAPWAFGAGEEFCDCFSSGDADPTIGFSKCGALIITDYLGNPRVERPRFRREGLDDYPISKLNVWTPGERFLDIDGDMRWDAVDEVNDQMCDDPDGCRNACSRFVCSDTLGLVEKTCRSRAECSFGAACVHSPNSSDVPCESNANCPTGERCGDPDGSGPRGCKVRGCGNLPMACVDFTEDGTCGNEGDCVIPELKPCVIATNCPPLEGSTDLVGSCLVNFGVCAPPNCVPPAVGGGAPELPGCCEDNEPPGTGGCVNGVEGITCGTAILCCEFHDFDDDGQPTVCEPFEDFMVRWNPDGATNNSVWKPVDAAYIRANYPGDVETLVARTGNGWYDSPDVFFDLLDADDAEISTKMMQDAGVNRSYWTVPKPGSGRYDNVGEKPWFDPWWNDRYGTTPPAWPGGSGENPGRNSKTMRPFDPNEPVPPIARGTPGRRWFQPNRGGLSGDGDGTVEEPSLLFSIGSDNFDGQVLPEEEFGYYDGWTEYDDLASSKYHAKGDQRLGEITSPNTDTINANGEVYTAIFGADLGPHDPNAVGNPDSQTVAAGPYAVNIHGDKGYDAGDACITEWLTWRTDGTSSTPGYGWERDNGPYHPIAGKAALEFRRRCSGSMDQVCVDGNCLSGERCTTRRCMISGLFCRSNDQCGTQGPCLAEIQPFGFRDYNLDGMIDQGEVRPERSENYSADSNPFTENDGTVSDYPFNRRRLVEDMVEGLDASVDWDDFIDVNSMNAHLCSHGGTNQRSFSDPKGIGAKSITAQGFVSGIVIIPALAYTDRNLFPLAPSYYPIHNEDNVNGTYMIPDWPGDPLNSSSIHQSFNLWFHDLAICANCRAPAPSVIPYAAHEYGHTWEGFPDLYDYDIFDPPSQENCPVGTFDLMSGGRGGGRLVHFTPPLKNSRCSRWIDPVDLTTVVTPGVQTRITLPPAEIARDGYYYLDNEDRPGERYWLWSVGLGFDRNLPSNPQDGMLVMHFDSAGANPDALPLQQRTEPFSYYIVQADGRGDLEECESGGNVGDQGDIWPGTSNNQTFNFHSTPSASWYTQDSWTGLDISDIQPDGFGSTLVTLTWIPTNISSLRFVQPPGGDSVGTVYQVRYEATDVHGGTSIRLYATTDPNKVTPGTSGVTFLGSNIKNVPGTLLFSQDWHLTSFSDGRYYLFAKLVPGPGGNDQIERSFTLPRASRNNVGDGALTVNTVDTGPGDLGKARSETWTARLFNIETDGTQDWLVNSSLTQPAPQNDPPKTKKCTDPRNGSDPLDPYPHLCLKPSAAPQGVQYTSKGGEVTMTLKQCTAGAAGCPSNPITFAVGDQFSFTTTGITAVSAPVTVANHRISASPTAVIKASPLSGSPPLKVDFDARDSSDPNGAPLTYLWDFGDNSGFGSGATVSHEYARDGVFTVTLRATNEAQRSGEAAVDIHVINNAPKAVIGATPTNGKSPLTVLFNGSSSSDTEDEGEEMIYQWDFGDGMTANDQGLAGQFSQLSHFYNKRADGTSCTASNPCSFTAKLTVTDTGGKQSSATIGIRVGNTDPVARVVASPLQGTTPLKVRFNASSSTDADNDPLKVDWDWKDTCTGSDPNLTNVDIKGNTPANDGTVEHTYKCVGTFAPRVVVKDGKGGESAFTGIQVVVTQGTGGGGESQLVARFRITPNPPILNQDFDVDASSSTGTITGYSWDWGDQTPASSGVTTKHRYTRAGSFTIVLTVTGPNNTSAQVSQRVTVSDGTPPEPGENENSPPTAIIVVEPATGFVDEEFRFDARRSTDPDGDPLTYSWTFGDGASGTGSVVTHTYSAPQSYTVRLTVRDSKNASTQTTQTVQVTQVGENRNPVAIIATGPRSGTAPVALTFDGRNSYDLDNEPITYLWEFMLNGERIDTMDGQVVTQLFSQEGTYQVILTVTDTRNGVTESEPIVVRISSPSAPPDDGGEPPPDEGEAERPEPEDSANQRPSACGLGMVMGFFGSLVGLTSARITRRKYRG